MESWKREGREKRGEGEMDEEERLQDAAVVQLLKREATLHGELGRMNALALL